MKALAKWEFNEPLRLLILLFGVLLLSFEFKSSLLSSPKFGLSNTPAVGYAQQDFLSMFNREIYLILSVILPFLATISIRRERDEGMALSIYALPYSKEKILITKFFVSYILAFVFVVSPHLLMFILHFSSTLPTVFMTFKAYLLDILAFYALILFYMLSISAFIAVLSPNSYVSIFASFFLLYSPLILNIPALSPATWRLLLGEGKIFSFEFLRITLLMSSIFFTAYAVVGGRRDVR